MAIEKNSFRVLSSNSFSEEDDEFQKQDVELDEEEDDYDDCDSGAGSDDFDLLELGEIGEEFCQIGDQTCSVPFELYDLSGLEDILSMDVWNDVLTEDERLNLTKYLPDMDQEHFMRTLKDLFTGSNFHFGVPMTKLFNMLKGGLCEPRVSLYRQGLVLFQKHRHYHTIRNHQNTMVNNLVQIHDAWSKCRGYSIEEKLRVLNIMKSQKSLIYEKMEELETESSEKSADGLWSNKKIKDHKPQWGPGTGPGRAHYPRFGKQNPKGNLKVSGSKMSTTKEQVSLFYTREARPGHSGHSGSSSFLPRQMRDREENTMYDVTLYQDHSLTDKTGKRFKGGEEFQEMFTGLPAFGRNRPVNQLSDIKVLTAKPPNSRFAYDYGKKLKRAEYDPNFDVEDALSYRNSRGPNLSRMDGHQDSYGHRLTGEPVDLYRMGMKKGRTVNSQNGGRVVAAAEGMQMLAKGEETESDSSDQFGEEDDDNNPLMRSKWAYPSGVKSVSGFKKAKFGEKNDNKKVRDLDGSLQRSRKTHGSNHFDDTYDDGPIESIFSRKTYTIGKKRKGEFGNGNDYSTPPSRSARKGQSQMFEEYGQDYHDMADLRLLECNSGTKKRKAKDALMYMDDHNQESQGHGQSQSQLNDLCDNLIPEGSISVMDMTEEDVDFETKTQKKPFPLITPTIHTGFSFSIIHLLSAVRMAMVTLLPEDNVDDGVKQEVVNGVNGDQGTSSSDPNENTNVPSLTVKDIVNRVRSNPGDPCILETQEPLQDLVRGVLKIFYSKTAPLGAKGWKPLVVYKKAVKSWSWVGPVSQVSPDHEIVEEVTSPDSWGLPHKMLVKLVDSFANWLKSGQETLKQIGSLPAPPLTLMQVNLDEKERFRDLRAQKSLNTITPSSDEVRDYFRKEEMLRYLIPDRAFAYTAVDGKKSTVAPSRKGAGKPTSKARDHFMLKRDRPPHVTILCLVRDAAARLPGSIGTRADVCTLIRDSQYIVEDVSDAQVNQVVSGALDRLHYERDPCVQFDGERKLWVYLHREREEEDFEDDGTSSTKKWKRQKKEPVETGEPTDGAVTLAYHNTGESTEPAEVTGFDLSIEPFDTNNEALGQRGSGDQDFDDEVEVLNNTSVS